MAKAKKSASTKMSPSDLAAQIAGRKDGEKIARILADAMDGTVTLPKSAFGAFGYLAKNDLGVADRSGAGFEFAINARGKKVFSELAGIMDGAPVSRSIPKSKKKSAKKSSGRSPGRPRKSDIAEVIAEVERSIPKSKKKSAKKSSGRGPGRPRKSESLAFIEGMSESLGPVRRGPGRPRKNVAAVIEEIEMSIPKAKKKSAKKSSGRGPGRPRKEMSAKQEERLIAQTAAKLQKTATAIQACAIVLGRRGGHAKYGTVPPYEYTSVKRGGSGPSDAQIKEEMKAIRAMFK